MINYAKFCIFMVAYLLFLLVSSCTSGHMVTKYSSLSEEQQRFISSTREVRVHVIADNPNTFDDKEWLSSTMISALSKMGFNAILTNDTSMPLGETDALLVMHASRVVGTATPLSGGGKPFSITRISVYGTLKHGAKKTLLLNFGEDINIQGPFFRGQISSDTFTKLFPAICAGVLGNLTPLEELLKSDELSDRYRTVHWLGAIGNPNALGILKSQLDIEKDKELRVRIEETINMLKS